MSESFGGSGAAVGGAQDHLDQRFASLVDGHLAPEDPRDVEIDMLAQDPDRARVVSTGRARPTKTETLSLNLEPPMKSSASSPSARFPVCLIETAGRTPIVRVSPDMHIPPYIIG